MEKSKETVTENKVVLTLDDVRKLIKAPDDASVDWNLGREDACEITVTWTSKPKPRKARDPE